MRSSNKAQDHFSLSLESFRNFCTHFLTASKFKVRIVSTRGPSGTKCPQWHLDHIPVRWIESLTGQGCHYIQGSGGVNWEAVNNLNDETMSIQDRNEFLVNQKLAKVSKGKPGEGVVLVGNGWSEYAKDNSLKLQGVIHKSPAPIQPWEGRVLLIQDICW